MPDTGSNAKLKDYSKVWVYGRNIKASLIINYYNSMNGIFQLKEFFLQNQSMTLGLLHIWEY